jgi:5-methyltetrahydrofolate--homocysteine methyltransferase
MFELKKIIKEEIFLLDGAMGTELISSGLPQGHCPEGWNEENPEAIARIHQAYFEAGSRAVLTNSFGGNAIKLAAYSLQNKTYELNFKAATIARSTCPEGRYVGGSVGPTGKFLKPMGELSQDQLEQAFIPQIKGLVDGGVDFLLIETQYDLREALVALGVARRETSLPVLVTMTFNLTRRGYFTLMGNNPKEFVRVMEENQVEALGANCTLNSREMVSLIEEMHFLTRRPLIAQANAGKPEVQPDGKVKYSQGIDEYVSYLPRLIAAGTRIIGGCCGTSPEYIKKMAEAIKIFYK